MNQEPQKDQALTPSQGSRAPSVPADDKFAGITTHQQVEHAAIAVAAKERALIEGAYIMAKKFPRNEADARARILNTCKIYSFAEKAIYRKPIGKDFITGPSIRLAEEMMRQWGHMRVEAVVLYDDPLKRIVQVSAIDMQTGANGIIQFTIEKTVERKNAFGREVIAERLNSRGEKVSIVLATEDEVMVKQNAMLSKYRRNLILQLMPVDILEDCKVQVAEAVKKGVAASPDREKKIVMDNFAKIGVLPSEIEQYLGHPIAQLVADEIVELKEVFMTIHDGEDTWKNVLAAKLEKVVEVQKPETAAMPEGQAPADAPGETAWEQEDREKAAVAAQSGQAFKPGDPSTHQSVQTGAKRGGTK